jgi:hypothetical protein
MTFLTIVYCELCGLWRDSREDVIIWDEHPGQHAWWCSAQPEPVRCTGTTLFPLIDFPGGEQCS